MATNSQVLDAAGALQEMSRVNPRNPQLTLRIAAMRTTLAPIAEAVREGFAALQQEHQQFKDGEYLFSEGGPLWKDPFVYMKARKAMADADSEIPVPERKPLNFHAFPKEYPWLPDWAGALKAIGWLDGAEEED